MMELGLQERTDVIASAAQLVSWRIDAPDKASLPTHTSIIEAYDDASAGLLILGAPGAGKSTLLRELAGELLIRAEQDPTHPIPVIVNLSSWAIKKLPLSTWLVEQLQMVYAIPRHLSQAWIEQNQFLLLLDGLDEVEASLRPTYIEYINAYRADHFVPIVVCSRSREYLTQEQRLMLPYAVEVQSLNTQQVDDYLKRVGKPLAAVRTALHSNAVLRELVTTPLMLSMVMLTYRGKTAKDLPHLGTAEEQQHQVFEHYVARMLEQPTRKWYFTSQQIQTWLIWLAQQMGQHQLTEFYLERLQGSWLPTKRAQVLYSWLVLLLRGLLFRLLGGLLGGLLRRLLFGLIALAAGLLTRPLSSIDIQPAETLSWSWSRAVAPGVVAAVVACVAAGLAAGLLSGLLVGLVMGLIVGLVSGFSERQLDEHMRLKPNQGIQSSGRNALRVGLLGGLPSGLLMGLFSGLPFGLVSGLAAGLVGGLVGVLTTAALLFEEKGTRECLLSSS